MPSTRFFGSQIGGQSVINYSYTDLPWKLFFWDVYYFFSYLPYIPYVLWPVNPSTSGYLDELSLTPQNIFCIAVHLILVIFQLAFILILPFTIFLPVTVVIGGITAALAFNWAMCLLLNGSTTTYTSDPAYAVQRPEHAHEQWIFINGVAVGEHWMKSNLNRLALTFGRPVLGIHNKTNGILFDVLECLIQRNLGYATKDVRVCYALIKEKLYDPGLSKVIFVLHSQGGIEGSLILDWLLQECPQDLLAKLEVYTFGNAANHFNNPHRHVGSQARALRNPVLGEMDAQGSGRGEGMTNGLVNGQRTPTMSGEESELPSPVLLKSETTASEPNAVSDRAIGHIEHYAHTTDFVALWGVIHFATAKLGSISMPRFIGRVFLREGVGGGHQMCQHYLDNMFPLARNDKGEFIGCLDDETEDAAGRINEFIESDVVVGAEGTTGRREDETGGSNPPVEVRGRLRRRAQGMGVKMKVKDLSRLWKYRNGRTPGDKPPLLVRGGDGVIRGATM